MSVEPQDYTDRKELSRSFGLLQATALNVANMVGVGPFITIPLLMAAMGGPQSLLGWLLGALIVVCDGQVWSELGAALPGSGGSYRFLREAYGPDRWGRLMAFLFIWQFVFSGPLEIASGMIGFAQYARYLWPDLGLGGARWIAAGVGVLAVLMLARRVTFLSRLTLVLFLGTAATLLIVVVTGLPHFQARRAFDFPPGAFAFHRGFFLGLGGAALIAVYDYLGYYDVCYIGDEVKEPARVIPRSILYAILGCAAAYMALHLSLLGVLPWREMLGSQFVVSQFMETLFGRRAAVAVTLLILWTAFGSVFALLLGYSRVPYAAAMAGDFFRPFARLHPTKGFPHVSLFVLGGASIAAAFFTLDQVVSALITTRVVVQFMAQVFALPLLRRRLPASARPYRMWLYPVPAVIAFVGWAYIFLTSGWGYVLVGMGTLVAGIAAFLVRSRLAGLWPFVSRPVRVLAAVPLVVLATDALAADRLPLSTWRLQSSAEIRETGSVLSTPGFADQGWHPAAVPTTVLAALVAAKVHPDPYFGMNLRTIPGTTYPIGQNFAQLPVPADSPFAASWWYRTEFSTPAALAGRHSWLHFDGINYRANVWLDGQRIASADDVAGAYRRYELDVTPFLRGSGPHALAVEVFAPGPRDLAMNWVDWNPMPPDKDMGLWGDVWLTSSGPIALRHPLVVSRLDPTLDVARLTVSTELWNATDARVRGVLRGRIEAVRFSQVVELAPHERKPVRFTPEDVPALVLRKPRLWWPYRLGPQNLYTLSLAVEAAGVPSDRQEVRFGVQEITSELTEAGHRLFKVNGRPILIRGGGWAPDMLLRQSPERLKAEIRYVKEMGLNAIRLEGKLETDAFFDLTDREGILVLAGWCCCDHWEEWDKWTAENRRVAVASLTDQVRRLRSRPSVLAWLNGSDNPPPPEVEKAYLEVLRQQDWPKPVLSSATAKPGASGPTGVKMAGPYDYVPPSYWLSPSSPGGHSGFNSETSPGAAVPPLESLREMIPSDHLWPMDAFWTFHAGGQQFKDLKLFTAALEARYGPAAGVEDYARKAQALAYEGERAMFEAFGRNKYATTGVVQWMLNNAWPSLIWHLYDYFLRPGGGYFGAKKACEPLHVQYSYDDRSIVVVNDLLRPFRSLNVAATVYDFDLTKRHFQEASIDVPADGVVPAFKLPALAHLTTTYFLRLEVRERGRHSSNFYWLSTRADELDWKQSDWYHTPVTSHADLTDLAHLPPTTLAVSGRFATEGGQGRGRIRVTNTGNALAFQVRLKLDGPDGREILPVFWEDNYFELLPGESRDIGVRYSAIDRAARVSASGWNTSSTADHR